MQCHTESVLTELPDHERKQAGKSFINAVCRNMEHDKVQGAMTSLLQYALFIIAFSNPLIIHQC